MAFVSVPEQDFGFMVPDDGQVVRLSGTTAPEFLVRIGNTIYKGNVEVLGHRIAESQGKELHSAAEAQQLGFQFLEQQGINYNSLPEQSFNQGDVNSFFSVQGLDDPNQFAQVLQEGIARPQQSGEVITATTDPDNPNSRVLTSNQQGVISQNGAIPVSNPAQQASPQQATSQQLAQSTPQQASTGQTTNSQLGLTPEEQAQYEQLPPELKSLYDKMQTYVDGLIQEGQQVNPDINIDAETLKQFQEQAARELEPFFNEREKLTLVSLNRELGNAIKNQLRNEEDATRLFGERFEQTGESAAARGITFSGERLKAEKQLADRTNEAILRGRQDLQAGVGNALLQAESKLGSEALSGTSLPDIGIAPTVTAQGAVQTGTGRVPLGQVQGDIFGELPRQQLTAQEQRTAELEEAARRSRSLIPA